MTEEAKKAIENLKFCLTTNNEISIYDGTTILVKITDIQILLNLLSKKDKVIAEIKSIIENEFDTFTSHDNNFNLGDMQLLQDIILDKIDEKVGR